MISSLGRRKEAVARVRLADKPGQITVNGKAIEQYFPGVVAERKYLKPFEVIDGVKKFSASVKVLGGGFSSQLQAVVHGFSRALAKIDEKKYRPQLKKAGLLTRDARVKERRKYGHAQKARKRKQSPKR